MRSYVPKLKRSTDEERYLWLELEMDRIQEEDEERERELKNKILDEQQKEAADQAKIHKGYYNQFD